MGLCVCSRREVKRIAWKGAVAIVVLMTLVSCATHRPDASVHRDPIPLPPDTLMVPAAEIGTYGGRFVIATTSGPRTFNALLSNEQTSNDVNNLLYAALAGFDNETQQMYPQLAKSWEQSPDGLVWTWHLRRGACFSDGHPITSADVLFMFELAYDPVLPPSLQDLLQAGGKPFQVTAPDSYTVVTKLAAPHALTVAAVGALRIMPRHVL